MAPSGLINPSVIYFDTLEDRPSFVGRVFEIYHDEIAKKRRILVKPNIVSHEEYPTTTHPQMLEAVLVLLLKMGKEVLVGDAPAADVNSRRVMAKTGLGDVCRKYRLELINFNNEGSRRVRPSGSWKMGYSVSRIPLECDGVISLPVLKVHRIKSVGLTGALKCQFGCLSKMERIACHLSLRNIHRTIAGINAVVKPDLFIVDAISILLRANEVRHGGQKESLGILYAGKDPVALDCYGLRLLSEKGDSQVKGRSPDDIPYIRMAAGLRIGSPDYQLQKI